MQKIKLKGLLPFFMVIIPIFAVVLLFNFYTPFTVDDFCYHLNFATGELLTDFHSVVQSMQYHYHFTNGRIIAHSLVQLVLLYLNKSIFNVINSFVFVLLGCFILCIANRREQRTPFKLLLIYLVLLTLSPAIGQTMFWLDGAINYLWGATFICGVMAFCTKLLFEPPRKNIAGVLLLAFVSFFAGGWSENSSAVFIYLLFMYTVVYFVKYRKVQAAYVVSVITAFVGWAFMITAPANSYRKNAYHYASKRELIDTRIADCFLHLREYIYIFLIFAFILLVFAMFLKVSKTKISKKFSFAEDRMSFYLTLIYALGSLLGNFAMLAAPYAPRSAFGPVTFMFIALCIFASCFKLEKRNFVSVVSSAIILVCTSALILSGLTSVYKFGTRSAQLEEKIYAQIENGETNITVDAVMCKSQYGSNWELEHPNTNPEHWLNWRMAVYYNADTVTVGEISYIEPEIVERAKNYFCAHVFGLTK